MTGVMLTPNQKLKVFISSACGKGVNKEKYNYVREGLKVLIEATGLADVYVFESEGASTISAENHFSYALQDSNICIFIIDNKDGVPPGVQKEVEVVKKFNIKSLFYFCDKRTKKETQLQKSLMGAEFAKSVVVHDLKEVIGKAAQDLINDLVLVYMQYCKGSLSWINSSDDNDLTKTSSIQLSTFSDSIMKKEVLSNADKCFNYFTNLIWKRTFRENIDTSNLDEMCAKFLAVLFESASFSKEDMNLFLEEIEKHQNQHHFEVTKKRFEAIFEYFKGNQEGCLSRLNEALVLSENDSVPKWLKDDILIDLRNQSYSFNESNNNYDGESKYQRELMNGEYLIYYPQLDRSNSNFQEKIILDYIKGKTKSLNTEIYSNTPLEEIECLVGMYIVALCNGSLTQIEMIYKRLKYFCFYEISQQFDWNTAMLLLKTTILSSNREELDGIVRFFREIHKMDSDDALALYYFTNNARIPHKRFADQLKIFGIVAYYFNDDIFLEIWGELYESICKWIDTEGATVSLGYEIFSSLEKIGYRIPQNDLINIICKSLKGKLRKFYDEIFKLIYSSVDLNLVQKEQQNNLIQCVIEVVSDSNERSNVHKLDNALIRLRNNNKAVTEDLDMVIQSEMPEFYNGNYRLETICVQIEDVRRFVTEIEEDNKKQGKNGTYYRKAIRPHLTIKNILKRNTSTLSTELIDEIFEKSVDTVLNENQLLSTKLDAIELLVYLLGFDKNIKKRNAIKISEFLEKKEQALTAQTIFTNLNELMLETSILILECILEVDVKMQLINNLAIIGDDGLTNRNASRAFLNYIESCDLKLIQDGQLEQLFILSAIKWCNLPDTQTRINAVKILFVLLDNPLAVETICNQLIILMDNDNVYIKTEILYNLPKLLEVNLECYNFILQKSEEDSNFIVKEEVKKINSKNQD